MKLYLKDVATIQYGYAFDSKLFTEDSSYPQLARIRDVKRGYSETYYKGDYSIDYVINKGDLLIGMDGEFNIARWKRNLSLLNQRVCKISANELIDEEYLRYSLMVKLKKIEERTAFVTVKHLSAKELNKIQFDLPNKVEQIKISNLLNSIEKIITFKKQQIDLLDNLIKSRFIELFGDPVVNSMSWAEELIGDSCFVTKLAGFEYTQYIHYEDSGDVVMVKAQNVKNGKLNRKDLSYISKEVSDSLPRSQLAVGDVVMTYVGANIGDVAVIDSEYKYHLAPNVAKIRPNAEKYNSIYFMYMLMFLNSYIVGNSADTAKAALGMERIRKLKVFVPPIELQNGFAAFVEQTDKSKFEIQKSIDETRKLFDSLMQEYFG